ncbi:hypothetical protein DGG96_14515 [Legionella qingyii]|uniref:Uncharacterized protein n=1 Tax=Legionella qingyii TaxID=2184757 RepID=A0A317U351_9GAMM|nr:hypothetical protein DGG96_14515 [Legionella qingyii]
MISENYVVGLETTIRDILRAIGCGPYQQKEVLKNVVPISGKLEQRCVLSVLIFLLQHGKILEVFHTKGSTEAYSHHFNDCSPKLALLSAIKTSEQKSHEVPEALGLTN